LALVNHYFNIHTRDLATDSKNNLLASPAQFNFSSVQHPVEWIEKARAISCDVLLGATAFVPTNWLDQGAVKPDFVPLSFYKMFGYPTSLGALIAHKAMLGKLRRPLLAGGRSPSPPCSVINTTWLKPP
jgi:molybdenum cofactor sulfurtransferase